MFSAVFGAEEAGTDEVAALGALLAASFRHATTPSGAEHDDEADLPWHVEEGRGPGRVLPRQRDEFTCANCHLLVHLSRRAHGNRCADCG